VSADGRGSRYVQLALLGEAVANLDQAAVFVWDEDRNYVAANEAACALAGLQIDELLRMRVGDLSPDRASPHFEDAQRRRQLAGRSSLTRRDGSEVAFEFVTFHTRIAELPYFVSICWPCA
jgi:PAS domain S-box-containing protein